MKHCTDNLPNQAQFFKTLTQQLGQWKTEPSLTPLAIQFLCNKRPTYQGTKKNLAWITQLIQEQQAYGHEKMWLGFRVARSQ